MWFRYDDQNPLNFAWRWRQWEEAHPCPASERARTWPAFSPSGDGRPFTGGQADGLLRVVLGLVMGIGGRTANVALLPHHPRHAALRKARRSAWPWDRTRRSSRPGREEGRSVSVNLLIRRTTLDDPKATTTPKDGCDDSGALAACGPKLLPRSDHYLDHYDSRRTGRHLQ